MSTAKMEWGIGASSSGELENLLDAPDGKCGGSKALAGDITGLRRMNCRSTAPLGRERFGERTLQRVVKGKFSLSSD